MTLAMSASRARRGSGVLGSLNPDLLRDAVQQQLEAGLEERLAWPRIEAGHTDDLG